MTKTITNTTEQRTIDYILHWGEQHELFDEAHEENTKRHHELYDTYTCDLCGKDFLHSMDMYTCNECLDNLPL